MVFHHTTPVGGRVWLVALKRVTWETNEGRVGRGAFTTPGVSTS